jgi:hypothetical protein
MTAVLLLIVNLLRASGVPVPSDDQLAVGAAKGPTAGGSPGSPPPPPGVVADPIAISNGF